MSLWQNQDQMAVPGPTPHDVFPSHLGLGLLVLGHGGAGMKRDGGQRVRVLRRQMYQNCCFLLLGLTLGCMRKEKWEEGRPQAQTEKKQSRDHGLE